MKPKVALHAKRADILEHYQHPWVFSKGLTEKPDYPAGTLVRVVSRADRHMGWAFYHPHNPIALRMVSFGKDEPDKGFWKKRIERAFSLRQSVLPPERKNFRLIHGENDGFPGLTADVFGSLICLQNNVFGFEAFKAELAGWLMETSGAQAVYERSEGYARRKEGLEPHRGFLIGSMEFPLEIEERGLIFSIDPANDQKTGFFLDQYAWRAWVEAHAHGKNVLDLCCYSGGFTFAALRGGARSVLSLDVSQKALSLLAEGRHRNGLDADRQESVQADVFEWLRNEPQNQWDLVVLDPPALAKAVSQEMNAKKAYRKLNRDAIRWTAPNGVLTTFSCSGVVSAEAFRQSVFLGARDAAREAILVRNFGAGPDHPIDLRFPEGTYLKGMALFLP